MISSITNINKIRNNQNGLQDDLLTELADIYTTPLYVYDGDKILENFYAFQKAVSMLDCKIHFAVKANSSIAILYLLGKAGSGADIVSGGELQRALAANIKASDIIFSGVGKTDEELLLAMQHSIGQINVESGPELERLSDLASSNNLKCSVALRVNVDVDPGSHVKISTGQNSTKFGISINDGQAENYYQKITLHPNLVPAGLAVHIGSQIRKLAPFEKAYKALLNFSNHLRSKGFDVPCLDLGGGVGVDYETNMSPDFFDYGALVNRLFANQGYRLGFEPGRSIVANSGNLITKVIYVKQGFDKRFIIVDAAMNDFIRPTLYDAYHKIDSLRARGDFKDIADIVGPICETGDYLAKERLMPLVEAGDYLAVRSAGAYGAVMMSNYNTRPEASEVLYYNGEAHLVRKRRTVEELIKMDTNPFV